MNHSDIAYARRLFGVSAFFNLLVAAGLLLPSSPAWSLLAVPFPAQPMFLHLFLAIVATFGVAYFWIARAPAGKQALIVMGAVGKLAVFMVIVGYWFAGMLRAPLLGAAAADLVFAVLFLRFAFRTPAL